MCKYFVNVHVYLFADDAKLYWHILSDEDHYSLQSGLCALQEWSDKWLRKLNASRCKSVYYSRILIIIMYTIMYYVELCIQFQHVDIAKTSICACT